MWPFYGPEFSFYLQNNLVHMLCYAVNIQNPDKSGFQMVFFVQMLTVLHISKMGTGSLFSSVQLGFEIQTFKYQNHLKTGQNGLQYSNSRSSCFCHSKAGQSVQLSNGTHFFH
jgi:hypothetical protein